MAVLYSYSRNSQRDKYFFEDPYKLQRSPVDPLRFNLQNGVMIRKHVHVQFCHIWYLKNSPLLLMAWVAVEVFYKGGRLVYFP
jgi:hypothetical protein